MSYQFIKKKTINMSLLKQDKISVVEYYGNCGKSFQMLAP